MLQLFRSNINKRAPLIRLALVLLLAVVAICLILQAQEQRNFARARELAAQSLSTHKYSDLMTTSGLLAVESSRLEAGLQENQALINYLNLAAIPTKTINLPNSSCCLMSPHGTYIMATNEIDKILYVWETKIGLEIDSMVDMTFATSLAFSPDEKYIAFGGKDKIIRVRDINSRQAIIAHMLDDNLASMVAFSPDGKYIVSSNTKGHTRVWDTQNWQQVFSFQGGAFTFTPDTAWNSGKKYIISKSGGTITIWDIESKKEVSQMEHYFLDVFATTPDGKYLITGGLDRTLRVWDIHTGHELRRMFLNGSVTSIDISPNPPFQVVSGSMDKTVRIWDIETGQELVRLLHDDDVTSVAFSPISFGGVGEQYVISGSIDKTARLWNIRERREIARMPHDGKVYYVAFHPDGEHLITSWRNTIQVWKTQIEGQPINAEDGLKSQTTMSSDGSLLATSNENKVTVFNVQTGNEIAQMEHDEKVISIAISSNGQYVAAGGNEKIQVWEVQTGKEIFRIMARSSEISLARKGNDPEQTNAIYLAFLEANRYKTRIWDIQNKMEVFYVRQNAVESLNNIVLSPNGTYIALVSRSNIQVLETKTANQVFQTKQDHIQLYQIDPLPYPITVFSPDEKYIAFSSSDKLRIWDLQTQHEISQIIHSDTPETKNIFNYLKSFITSIAFSPAMPSNREGKYIVSSSTNGSVRVWDIQSGREISRQVYEQDTQKGYSLFVAGHVAFDRDGKHIIFINVDGSVNTWYWNTEDLINEACSRLPRNFTRNEWDYYFTGEPYRATCPNLPLEPEPTPTSTPYH